VLRAVAPTGPCRPGPKVSVGARTGFEVGLRQQRLAAPGAGIELHQRDGVSGLFHSQALACRRSNQPGVFVRLPFDGWCDPRVKNPARSKAATVAADIA